MPKITHREYKIDGQYVKIDVCYSARNKRFYAIFPPQIAAVLDQTMTTGDTQDEAEKHLDLCINEYGNRKTTEAKVIFYTFKSMVRPINYDGPNQSSGNTEMCSMGVALDLYFRVGYVIRNPTESSPVNKGELFLNENHERDDYLHYESMNYLGYTPEREQFFIAFREWLASGITKMQDFFKQAELPVLMDEAIRSQKALLFKES